MPAPSPQAVVRGLVLVCLAGAATAGRTEIGHEVLPRLPVVGLAQPLEVDLASGFTGWKAGRYFWSRRIDEPGAGFLKVHFPSFSLGAGQRVEILDAEGRVRETLRGTGPAQGRPFWSLPVRGSEIVLRFSDRHAFSGLPFTTDRVMVGRTGSLQSDLTWPVPDAEGVCLPSQFEPVACHREDPIKWSNVEASVGVLVSGPQVALFCSGVNLDGDRVLTNAHCADTQAECANTDFIFRYWRQDCEDGSAVEDWVSFRCSELLITQPFHSCEAGPGALDFSLFSVRGEPSREFGTAAPDPTRLTDGEAVYVVQHPGGGPRTVTHGQGPAVDIDGTILRYRDTLDTGAGSSGAPIFRVSDGRLVGIHQCGGCGYPELGNRGVPMSEILPWIQRYLRPNGIFSDGFEEGTIRAWDSATQDP